VNSLRQVTEELIALQGAIRQTGVRARADNGVSVPCQIVELVRLRIGGGKLTAEDYYRMRVYRKELSFAQKREFISQGAVHLVGGWAIVAHDKLIAQALLEKEGVRTAPVRAVCHPLRSYGGCPVLRTPEEVLRYLDGHVYPFVAKPVTGIFSEDIAVVEAIDKATGVVRLAEDRTVPLREFADRCINARHGMLFQEKLNPHPSIVEHVSPRLCTLRLIVLLERNDVRLFRALWKIAGNGNVADNYWRPGNSIARLDLETGQIEKCMTGLGPDFRHVERSPSTGRPLRGFSVPFYGEAVELVRRAARAFVGIKMQAWDVAVTPDGPVALEVNEVGSVFLPQVADGRGMNDEEFRAYVARVRN
jgi:hypothetical protein